MAILDLELDFPEEEALEVPLELELDEGGEVVKRSLRRLFRGLAFLGVSGKKGILPIDDMHDAIGDEKIRGYDFGLVDEDIAVLLGDGDICPGGGL